MNMNTIAWTDGQYNWNNAHDQNTVIDGATISVRFDTIGNTWWIDGNGFPAGKAFHNREAAKALVASRNK